MRYFYLSPEVAGGLGKNTLMNRTVHPPEVTRLHYELEGWLGDDLLESFPCFVVTQRLVDAIRHVRLTGVKFYDVEITISEQFREFYPDRQLPRFVWMKVVGQAGADDFGLDKENRLVVSQRALQIVQNTNLKNCEVSE